AGETLSISACRRRFRPSGAGAVCGRAAAFAAELTGEYRSAPAVSATEALAAAFVPAASGAELTGEYRPSFAFSASAALAEASAPADAISELTGEYRGSRPGVVSKFSELTGA